MTSGYDIRNKIVDLLTNGGTDPRGKVYKSVIGNLTDIDTERGTTTLTPKSIDYKWGQNQHPFIIVDNNGSELINDEELINELTFTPEIFSIDIMFKIKGSFDVIQDWAENYIDAIKRSLHGWCSDGITWMLVTNHTITELYTDKNQTTKGGAVGLEVRIN